MKAKEFMIRDVISVRPETTVRELLALFVQHRIGGVPVVDADNRLLGMISDGDVIRYLAPRKEAVHDLFYTVYYDEGETEQQVLNAKTDTAAADMMHKRQLYTVREEEDFEDVIRILSRHHFKKLPVLSGDDRVVGVISRGDIIHNLSKMILAKGK